MTPPHNLEAEQAVLGAVLFNNRILERLPPLEATTFYDPLHGWLWDLIVTTVRAGKLADALALREVTKGHEGLAEVGGAAYLLKLLAGAARMATEAIQYAELLRDMAARREVFWLAQNALQECQTGEGAPEIVGRLETGLRSITFGESQGVSLREAGERMIANLDDPNLKGASCGFKDLDDRLGGFFPGELILLAGRPSMGKTAMATNLARSMAGQGKRGHFASYEMGFEQIAGRSLAAAAFETEGSRFEYARLRRGGAGVDRTFLSSLTSRLPDSLIIDDSGAQTLPQLDASLRTTRRRLGGLDFVIVDYLQLMRSTTKGTRNDQITEISQGLKAMAKRYRVPIVALSQLSRQNEQREDKRPQLSDLRDSGSLEQDADVVLGVYRESYYLERAEPKPENFKADKERSSEENFNIAYWEWEAKMRKAERTLEVCTLKQRNGPVGTDTLDFWAQYDVALDSFDTRGRAA